MKKTVHLLLLLLFYCLMKSSSSKNTIQDYLQRGSSLSVGDDSNFMTSPDNTFTCGFYSFETNAYWFAIWYTNSIDRTVVWTANTNKPINGKGSKLTLQTNGAMVLTDVDGTFVWTTNPTSTDVNRAMLLNTGNLVVVNKKGEILWQSFDYPTNTLLPSQRLTKSTNLISALRKRSFEPGYFSLRYDTKNVLTLFYDGPEISSVYWPSPNPNYNVFQFGRTSNFNNSRYAMFNDLGVFDSTDGWQFNASDMGLGIKRRLTMDYDGNLRFYSLNELTGLWLISWQAIAQPCDIHGICGRNGICVYGDKHECSCPPGHVWRDPSDLSKGCKPTFNTPCGPGNSTKFGFFRMTKTDYYGLDLNSSQSTSFESCRDMCLGDCRCEAFSYRLERFCYIKNALFNGYQKPNFQGNIYFKVPMGMETLESTSLLTGSKATCADNVEMLGSPSMYESSRGKMKWVLKFNRYGSRLFQHKLYETNKK